MNFSSPYRVLLKALKKACTEKPHHVLDLRLLLSLGIPSNTSFPPVYPENSSGSEAFRIDTSSLFEETRTDLRQRIEQQPSEPNEKNGSTAQRRLPLVATQLLHKKELHWIIERLHHILSPETDQSLRQLKQISQGPQSDDFIPDKFFDDESPVDGAKIQSEAEAVYSAGALGHHRDLVVLTRYDKEFPLMHFFVGPSLIGEEAFATRYSDMNYYSSLIQTLPSKIPQCCENSNTFVKIRTEVLLFDAEYSNKSEAIGGHFKAAHRQFYVHISAKPTKSKVLRIINIHFFRLEAETKSLKEDIGYLDSCSVLQMIRQRMKQSESSIEAVEEDTIDNVGEHVELKLAFKSDQDGPVVVKGILYFKHGESEAALAERAVEAIPFGPVLFQV